jgi:hypothetical protein
VGVLIIVEGKEDEGFQETEILIVEEIEDKSLKARRTNRQMKIMKVLRIRIITTKRMMTILIRDEVFEPK